MASKLHFDLKAVYPYYLGGKPTLPDDAERLDVLNKYTSEVAAQVAVATPDVIDEAVRLAVKSQKELKTLQAYQRQEVLEQVVAEMRRRRDELAFVLCIEAGKPIKDSYGEIDRAITTFKLAAEESTRIYGEYLPLDINPGGAGYQSIVKKVPIGPVSMISPFNFPANLAAHKIAPAIAVGCPFVLKPASRTPITALLLGEILASTALPPDSFSILPCSRDAADLFTTHPDFKLISFTGSPDVGWQIKSRSGKKPVVLELGGNAACIVDADADLDDAVSRIIVGGYYQSGQSCISVQRIIVHESILDAFRDKFVAAVRELKMGDPLDEDTFIGPMITEKDAIRCEEWVAEAVAQGAKVLVGGKRDGVFMPATVVEDVPKGTSLNDEEVFGPVTTLQAFSDFREAIELVNDSKFGLQAGVFTSNINKVFFAWNELEQGGVCINEVPSKRVDNQPYGGVKDSGLGREGLRYAIEDFTEQRILILRNIGTL